MTVNVWAGFSKGRNSTKQPTGGTAKTMTLKAPTSLIHPVMLVESFSLSDNYMQWGNRYYYIDDIVLVNNNLAEYHCSVDPLASWKSGIGGMYEFVARSASSYNPSLNDSFYPVRQDVFTSNVTFDPLNVSGSTGCYVMGIISVDSASSGSVTYYAMSAAQFAAMLRFFFAGSWLDQSETDITLATQKQLVNPFQYVVSCIWLPYDISGGGDDISFGYWQAPGVDGKILDAAQRNGYYTATDISLPAHPEASTRGKYLNGMPYTRRTLFCYGFGQIPLDPAYYVTTQKIDVTVEVDNFTGGGVLTVTDPGGLQIGQYHGQVGVPVQIAQMSQDIVHPITDIIGGALGLAYGNFAGFLSGIGNAVDDMIPQMQSSGSNGSSVDYTRTPHIVSEFRYQTPMDATHNGRPLCQNVLIGSLSGYIKTENAEVDLPCTQEERDMIAGYMDGGFYYE